MNLKEGMYVRTNKGIGKIKSMLAEPNQYIIYTDIGVPFEYYFSNEGKWISEYGKDFSFNILDLIEEEDLVVLEYYVAKYRGRIQRTFVVNKFKDYILFENLHCSFTLHLENGKYIWTDAKGHNPKIIEILTKEQFEALAYKVN